MIFLYNFSKIQNFQHVQKTVQHVVEPCPNISHAKFQVDTSIFGKNRAQKPYPLMKSCFSKLQFWPLLEIAQKEKWQLWNPEIKLVQKHTFLFKKKTFRKFDILWPGVDSTLNFIDIFFGFHSFSFTFLGFHSISLTFFWTFN